jgi:hypothetical protein
MQSSGTGNGKPDSARLKRSFAEFGSAFSTMTMKAMGSLKRLRESCRNASRY